MARGFGTTFGSATTDRAVSSLTAHASLRSYSAQVYRNGNGGGNLGRIFDKITGASGAELLYFNSFIGTYTYERAWTAQGQWTFTAPATGAWNQVGVTYDSGSASNDPVMYLNGASQSVTEEATPTGTLVNNSDAYVIGNRGNDSARNWDGMLAEFAIWDVILTADEMRALGAGVSPVLIRPASLTLYVPLVRDSLDLVGTGAITVTGTAAQSHPRVQYARRARVIGPAESVGGESSIAAIRRYYSTMRAANG